MDKSIRLHMAAYMLISMGGLLIHIRIHPPGQGFYFWLAAPVAAFSLAVIPILLSRNSTVAWGCLLNAATVLTGVIAMGYYSFIKTEEPASLSYILLDTTFPYILILLAKLPIAHAILLQMRTLRPKEKQRGCR